MADRTAIEWADATWNPIVGCSVVSPGCAHCYAMKLAGGRLRSHPTRVGLTVDTKAGPVWNGQVRFNPVELLKPVRWRRPRRIFVCAHGDLFHEAVPTRWIDQVYAVMALTPQHTYQVLTKRAAEMREYFAARVSGDPWAEAADEVADMLGMEEAPFVLEPRMMPLHNVWLGVSVEDQTRANERVPHLLATPAAVRFVSAEPLLGPVDLAWALSRNPLEIAAGMLARGQFSPGLETVRRLDWIIAGGESGPRPMAPAWARRLRDDCAAAGVPFFFKQWGSHAWAEKVAGDPSTLTPYRPGGKHWPGYDLLDGVRHHAMPDLRMGPALAVDIPAHQEPAP